MITLVVDFHSSTTYLQSQKFLALVTTLKYLFQSVRKILSGPCIYIWFREYCLQPWVSWSFLQNNCLMIIVLQKTPWTPGLQTIFHELNIYIYLIYIYYYYYYYYSCILDIEHSPYYNALGSTLTHKMTINTLITYIYIYIYIYIYWLKMLIL